MSVTVLIHMVNTIQITPFKDTWDKIIYKVTETPCKL